jgi:hypothetical protein
MKWTVFLCCAATMPLLYGCGQRRTAAERPQTINLLAQKPHAPADLSRSLNIAEWFSTGGQRDPLSIASYLAGSAGGDWLAVLPGRVDDVKWQPRFGDMSRMVMSSGSGISGIARYADAPNNSVAASIEAIRKSGTKIAVANKEGRMTLLFGTDDDLAHLRVHPPKEVAGALIQTQSSAGMVALVADFWKLDVRADPALLRNRDALLAARGTDPDKDEPTGSFAAMTGMYRTGITGLAGMRRGRSLTPSLRVRVDDRTTPEKLLTEIARYLGGVCRPVGSRWEIAVATDAKAVRAEIARLKGVIDFLPATEISGPSNAITGEPRITIATLGEEAEAALENIAAFGVPAITTLRSYLDPAKPAAATALRLLAAMPGPEAKRAVLDFARWLRSRPAEDSRTRYATGMLLGESVRLLAKAPDDQARQWLADAARDPRVSGELRSTARMALVKSEALSLLTSAAERAEYGRVSAGFPLRLSPEEATGPVKPAASGGTIEPLATCKGPDGSGWAVFLNGRCGDPSGLWLARGSHGNWQEFLYTGRPFPHNDVGYNPYGSQPPRPGCLKLAVGKDTVSFLPPESNVPDPQIATLQAKLNHPRLTHQQRLQISRQIAILQSRLWQRRANQLQQPITLSLADLRKDTDQDGLSDIAELPSGTDPRQADSDADGIADSQDINPLVARNTASTPRERFLQTVFVALYGGDSDPNPIIVILDRPYWQEFRGAQAPVYCMTKADFLKKAKKLMAWRVLQFGGPQESGSTILKLDGPCAYNDSGTRAEVHFWQWSPRTALGSPWALFYGMEAQAIPRDYLATFSRQGAGWRLEGIKPWKTATADGAVGEYLRQALEDRTY